MGPRQQTRIARAAEYFHRAAPWLAAKGVRFDTVMVAPRLAQAYAGCMAAAIRIGAGLRQCQAAMAEQDPADICGGSAKQATDRSTSPGRR